MVSCQKILQVWPMFAEHGNVLEVAIIKDKRTGTQQGMSFAVQVILDRLVYFGSIFVFQILFSDILLSIQRWAGLEECRQMLNISSYLQLVCNFSLSGQTKC